MTNEAQAACEPERHSAIQSNVAEGGEVAVETARRRLALQFQITSEFVRVPLLSKILSISSNAIYAQMRNGTFPILHRRVGNVVLVKLLDVADWYCHQDVKATEARETRAPTPPADGSNIDVEETVEIDADPAALLHATLVKSDETAKQRSARIKREVMAQMASRKRG